MIPEKCSVGKNHNATSDGEELLNYKCEHSKHPDIDNTRSEQCKTAEAPLSKDLAQSFLSTYYKRAGTKMRQTCFGRKVMLNTLGINHRWYQTLQLP